MTFNSAIFVFGFLPIAILVNLFIRDKYKNAWLLLCSLIFYGWTQPQFLWLLFMAVVIDYFAGLIMEKNLCKKWILLLSIVSNLVALIYFKYFNFLIEIFNDITGKELNLLNLVLPVGISFYTFKGISYVVDVYTGRIAPEKNLINLAVYICMFPEIMSGPIDRYGNLKDSISGRSVDADILGVGIERFVLGLSQKVIVANTLGVIVDDIWLQGAGALSWKTAWLGSICYSLQIYYDFAGYSNMAIGIGKMMGFTFAENFDHPYMSKSVTEFWRRWHMTLGEWFKYNIYYPLGGNRISTGRTYINLAVIFLLTGVWHGASWNFIIWGIMHGFFRIIEKLKDNMAIFSNRNDSHLKNVLAHIYLLLIVNFGWVLFRAPNMTEAIMFIKSMFGRMSTNYCGISVRYYLDRWNIFIIILAIVCSTYAPKKIYMKLLGNLNSSWRYIIKDIGLITLLGLCILGIVTNTYNSFIYFQF